MKSRSGGKSSLNGILSNWKKKAFKSCCIAFESDITNRRKKDFHGSIHELIDFDGSFNSRIISKN